ncbi:MAG: hypothetical protein FJ388_23940 [Verrucomicrobia bacterium]|nr:hypothetical protein [Verrucomicrobiota bacterium]
MTPTTYATNSSYSNAVFYGGSGSPAGDWASAYADAEANAINLAGERHPYYYAATFGLWATNGDHTATFHQQRLQNYWLSNSVFLCGIARSVDCYVFIGPWDFIAGSAAANHTTNFYCADFGITNAQWIALTNTASVTNARVMLPAITTTLPVTWCTNPATLSVTGEAASVVNTYFSSRDPIEDVYSLGVIVEYGRPIAREDCAVKATWAFEYK